MVRFWAPLVITLLGVLAGCGGDKTSWLQSISISPATASSQAQFVATGHYKQSPTTVSPLPALWVGIVMNGVTGPTITQDGAAQCVPGATGAFTIAAYAPADPNLKPKDIPRTKNVVLGTATLSCP